MEVVKTNLSTEELHRIVSFIGYGNPCQSVWFIGFEEGLGNMTDEDTWWNLKARGQFSPIMDIQKAHLTLRQRGQPIDISKRPPTTQVWRWAAKVMRAKEGHADWWEKREGIEYVKNCLGRTSGHTFLTEISPIPNRRNSDKKWASWFRGNVKDLDAKLLQRQSALKSLLESAQPKLVICYGLSKKQQFQELLGTELNPVCPGVFASADSKFLLVPFFGVGQMSRGIVESLLNRKLI